MSLLVRVDQFREIATDWKRILSFCNADTIFLTFEWQDVWWQEFGQQSETLLFKFLVDSEVAGIASLARNNDVISFLGGKDLYDYSDFLVVDGHESSFYNALLDYLEKESWETS